MYVALIHYAAPPIVGGVELVIARQAQQFQRSGHQVFVLAGRGSKWDVSISVRIFPLLDSRNPLVLKIKAALDSGSIPDEFDEVTDQIQMELKRHLAGVDVIFVHNVASLHKNLALTAALYRISQEREMPRFVLWHHDLAWTTPRYAEELHPGYPWDLLSKPWPGVRQVTISKERKRELAALMDIPKKSIEVVPGGVDMEDFLAVGPRTASLLKDIPFYKSAPILLTPVRITRRKNLELAVATLASLRKKMPKAILVITGPPGAHNPTNKKYFESLKKKRKSYGLKKALFFMADVAEDGLPDESISGLYRIADALFLPSREEGFGIPILEAGLSRMPIFCSDIPQLKALAGTAATYFRPDDDPEYIAGIIYERLNSDQVYQFRRKVRRAYTWQAIYKNKIEPLLEEG